MTGSPFVNEVVQILQKEFNHRISTFTFNSRTVILVSQRFFREAKEKVEQQNAFLGIEDPPGNERTIMFKRLLLVAAPWLTDYEFEFRQPELATE